MSNLTKTYGVKKYIYETKFDRTFLNKVVLYKVKMNQNPIKIQYRNTSFIGNKFKFTKEYAIYNIGKAVNFGFNFI